MREAQSDFRENLRFRVLRLLESTPQMSYRDIDNALGVSVGGVHYCLKALADKGMVNINNFKAADKKLHSAYAVTPHGLTDKALLAGRFLRRKMAECEKLRLEIEAIQSEMRLEGRVSPPMRFVGQGN